MVYYCKRTQIKVSQWERQIRWGPQRKASFQLSWKVNIPPKNDVRQLMQSVTNQRHSPKPWCPALYWGQSRRQVATIRWPQLLSLQQKSQTDITWPKVSGIQQQVITSHIVSITLIQPGPVPQPYKTQRSSHRSQPGTSPFLGMWAHKPAELLCSHYSASLGLDFLLGKTELIKTYTSKGYHEDKIYVMCSE